MKRLRSLGAACVLALAFAVPASAGHIETGITSTQPPAAASVTSTAMTDTGSVAGHIETGVAAPDSLTEVALNLISGVLALF